MGEKHVVRFEPVGIEIEVDEDQNVLRAAAEQGIMLMHGCKEGQCSSCKSFILDGDDIELDRYSTFALPDYEKEEGLHPAVPGARLRGRHDRAAELRRGHDPLRPAHPAGRGGGGVQRAGHPRHAASRPAAGRARRRSSSSPASTSTSRSRTPTRSGRSRWPTPPAARAASSSSSSRSIRTGCSRTSSTRSSRSATGSTSSGPFGVFTLREGRQRPGLRRRRRRHGTDPVACCGPWPSAASPARPRTTTAPGDRQDLCFEKELRELEQELPELPLRPGAVRADRGRRLGRRGRPDHRRRQAARDRSDRSPTPTCAGRHRWWRRRCRCSPTLGVRREAHLLRQVHDDR